MTKAGEAEQTGYLFSEQTRSCTAEGEPGKENGPDEAEGYFPAWACNGQKVVQWKYMMLKKSWDTKNGVVIKLKKINLWQNYKKKNCDITLKLKMWCN